MSHGPVTPEPVNPYSPPEKFVEPPELPLPIAVTKPPRVWTVFVAFFAAVVGAIGFQIVAAIGLVAWYLASGGTPKTMSVELPKLVSQPGAFIFLTGTAQLGILLSAIIPAWLSPVPMRERLGWNRPRIPLWHWPILLLGGILPAAIGIGAAIALARLMKPDPSVAALYDQMTAGMALPFILFIALAPGFNEETLFRGYIQTRLLQRWSPWLAIFVTSLLFALMHLMPHSIALAFPIGLWLGVLSWRIGSVWPSVATHALINGAWNVYGIGTKLGYLPDPLPVWFLMLFFGTAAICFIVSLLLLVRHKPPILLADKSPVTIQV